MENKEIEILPFGIKFGVIASLSVIIYSMILNITGLSMNQALGMVSYLIIGGMMYVASNNYKAANKGFISFGKGFSISMIVAAITAVFSSVFSYAYMLFVDDSMLELIKNQQLEELEKQGMSDAQIEQTMEMMASMMTPGMIAIMAVFMMLLVGAILGLIVSAIVKNPKPIFD